MYIATSNSIELVHNKNELLNVLSRLEKNKIDYKLCYKINSSVDYLLELKKELKNACDTI